MADCCSNLNRSRTELLASISSPTCERQIGFGVEAADFLRRLVVVEHVEVALLQIGNAAPMLVGHREHDVHFVGGRTDGGDRVVVRRRVRIGRLLLLPRRRWPAVAARRLADWTRVGDWRGAPIERRLAHRCQKRQQNESGAA